MHQRNESNHVWRKHRLHVAAMQWRRKWRKLEKRNRRQQALAAASAEELGGAAFYYENINDENVKGMCNMKTAFS
jgi:hypothetical protein